MITLQKDGYGRVTVKMDASRIKVYYELTKPVLLGYGSYSSAESVEQRYEQLPAGKGETDIPLRLPAQIPGDSAVMLTASIRTADGRTQLDRKEESIQRAEQAVRRDAATAAHAESWEPPPGATANHL